MKEKCVKYVQIESVCSDNDEVGIDGQVDKVLTDLPEDDQIRLALAIIQTKKILDTYKG